MILFLRYTLNHSTSILSSSFHRSPFNWSPTLIFFLHSKYSAGIIKSSSVSPNSSTKSCLIWSLARLPFLVYVLHKFGWFSTGFVNGSVHDLFQDVRSLICLSSSLLDFIFLVDYNTGTVSSNAEAEELSCKWYLIYDWNIYLEVKKMKIGNARIIRSFCRNVIYYICRHISREGGELYKTIFRGSEEIIFRRGYWKWEILQRYA